MANISEPETLSGTPPTEQPHVINLLLKIVGATERMATALEKANEISQREPGESFVTAARIRAAKRTELLGLCGALEVTTWAERQGIELSSQCSHSLRSWCLAALEGEDLHVV